MQLERRPSLDRIRPGGEPIRSGHRFVDQNLSAPTFQRCLLHGRRRTRPIVDLCQQYALSLFAPRTQVLGMGRIRRILTQ